MNSLLSRISRRFATQKSRPTHPKLAQARDCSRAGRLNDAEQLCRQVLAEDPANADAQAILGGVALQKGCYEDAATCFKQAIGQDPRHASYWQGLGIARINTGQVEDAIGDFKKAVDLAPKDAGAWSNLGNCYRQYGNLDEAVRCYRKALSLDPARITAAVNLGEILVERREFEAAVELYEASLKQAAGRVQDSYNTAPLHYGLGLALKGLGRVDEALDCYREAIAKQPNLAAAHNSLAAVFLSRNDLDAAMASLRQALTVDPKAHLVYSNLLMTQNYLPDWSQKKLYKEALKFDAKYLGGRPRNPKWPDRKKDKHKRLRIGYVSADFREHSVAFFTRNLPYQHDRENVEVYCYYSNVVEPDRFSQQFQAQADHWLSIGRLSDDAAAEQIRQDEIDILIDLTGHSADNRMMLFARKPAPILVTWLGYPNTTGLRTMDYRLTDAIADPQGEADKLHSETLIRLPHGFLCYQPDELTTAVAPLPALQQGHITFGSFNAIKKVNADVIRVWSDILKAVPGSRLILKSESLDDSKTREQLIDTFAGNDIHEDRLELVSWLPSRADHMALYSRVDIGLDPFPYNGTTTTCEALWMGVPVICMRGDRHASRVSASILQHAGLPECIADSEQELVQLAGRLADDTEQLAELRGSLRSRMQNSDLMNLPQFTRDLEQVYRQIWSDWCDS